MSLGLVLNDVETASLPSDVMALCVCVCISLCGCVGVGVCDQSLRINNARKS